jgi:hypothetical protein
LAKWYPLPANLECSTKKNMKKILLLLGACLLIAHTSHAQSVSVKMTKIITRDTSPDVPTASFAAKPRTLYRIGETYGRVEEEPDPDNNIQSLIIVSEPKIWIINLWDKTGRFMIDPAPSHVFRAPVISPEVPGQEQPLNDFEFGREYEFLLSNHAIHGNEDVDGKSYDKLYLTIGGFAISLLSHAGEERPYRVTIFKGQKLVLQVDYDYYKRDLEPKMTLFEPPQNIKITETDEA